MGRRVKQANIMAKNQKWRNRHVPKRTCVGCRQTLSKRELMRIVYTPEGIRYDSTGKANGRGAYVHNQRTCWEKALKGSLEKALHTAISTADCKYLQKIMESLPVEDNA